MNIQTIYKNLINKQGPPFTLEINPSNRCNLHCSFCDNKEKNINELPFKVYKEILNEAKDLGVSEIRIMGKKEPFIRKDILKIMSHVKKLGFYGFICTNGLLLKKNIAKKLVEYKWDRIEISLHGSNCRLHDKLVNKKGAFDATLRNIHDLNYYRDYTSPPKVGISTVLTNLNYKDIPSLVRLAKKIKMNDFILMPLILNKQNQKLKLSNYQIKEFDKELKKMSIKEQDIESNLEHIKIRYLRDCKNMQKSILTNSVYKDKILSIPCYFPWNYIAIDAEGYVSHCSFYKGSDNILEKELKDIWSGKSFNKIREDMKKRILPQACHRCCPPYLIDNEIIRNGLKTIIPP